MAQDTAGWTPVEEATPAGWTPVQESATQPVMQAATTPPPSTGRGAVPPPGSSRVNAPQNLLPRRPTITAQGVRSAAGMAGGLAVGAALPETIPWLLETALAGGGAAAGGAGAATLQGHPEEAGSEAMKQGLLEVGGRAVAWPFQRVARAYLGSQVHEAVTSRLSGAMDAAERGLQSAKQGAKGLVRGARDTAAEGIAKARELATGGTRAARTAATQATADATEQGSRLVEHQRGQFASAVTPPPSRTGVERDIQAAVQGPAQSTKEKIGASVLEHAKTGPAVDFRPVKAAVARMHGEMTPVASHEVPAVSMPDGSPVPAALQEAMQAQHPDVFAGLAEEQHPIRGVLGEIQKAPDTVPFEEAHKYKRLLDDAVRWDSPARTQIEQITKGTRNAVRTQMTAVNHTPYEMANAEYHKLLPAFKPANVQQLQKLASSHPQALTTLVKGTDRTKVQLLKELLLEHAPASGEEGRAMGEHAWNSFRAQWTHDRLVSGGVEKFGERLDKLDPELVQQLYGDEAGQAVLSRLKSIAGAFDTVRQASEGGVERTVKSGAESVAAAGKAGREGVDAARRAGRAGVAAAEDKGARGVEAASLQKGAVKEEQQRFAASTIAPPGSRTAEQTVVDLAHVASPHLSIGRWNAVKRLVSAPTGKDLLMWASYTPKNTQRYIEAVTGPAPELAMAALTRAAGLAMAASHKPTQGPSTTVTPPPTGQGAPVTAPPR